ncbi:MerR family transcriptional regulator, partial [Acetobacter pasteurianus]
MTDEAQTFSETGGESSSPTAENVSTNSAPSEKGPFAFRTISEVADELHVPQHTLRLWETQFHQVRPLKRGGGRRYYRPADIELLRHIADLLYTQGYTIKGVQRILQNGGVPAAETPAPETGQQDESEKQPETAVEAVKSSEVAAEDFEIIEDSSEKVVAVDDNASTIQPEPEPEPEP